MGGFKLEYNHKFKKKFGQNFLQDQSIIDKIANSIDVSEKDIIIEDNCWIGHSAHIMSGVTIHTGSVVGANAVVIKDVEPNTVVAGVPARVIAKL